MGHVDSDSKVAALPYVPFATLCTALDHLKTHGTPDKIDSSVFPSFSGGIVSHLLLSMRFLQLIDEKGKPQPILAQLVDDKTRKQTFTKIIPTAYSALFQRVDLAKASPSTLDEAIKSQNVRGATARKAKAFLLKAAQYSGLSISAHLLKRTRSSTTTRTNNGPRKSKETEKAKETIIEKPHKPSADARPERYSKVIKLPKAGGTLTLSGDFDPFALTGAEREFVYKLADLMADFSAGGKAKVASAK